MAGARLMEERERSGVTGGDLKRRIEAIMSNRAAHRPNYDKEGDPGGCRDSGGGR
jgi:hypothetical protein